MAKDIPDEALAHLYSPIGKLVVVWSIIDVALTRIVGIVYRLTRGEHGEKEVPLAFGRRLTFLRRCFDRISILSEYSAGYGEILPQIRELNALRDSIIHGHVSKYEEEGHYFTFLKLNVVDKQAGTHGRSRLRVSFADLSHAGDRGALIANSLIELTRILLEKSKAQTN